MSPGETTRLVHCTGTPRTLLVASLWSMASRNLASRVGGGIFGAGKSTAPGVKAEDVGVTFKDVGGADEAIGELQEIIQFLKTPQSFARLGGTDSETRGVA